MNTIIEIPDVRTPRLLLRAFRAADWESFAALNADAAFRRYLGDGRAWTREESWAAMEIALGQWALRGYGLWALEHEGMLVGRVGILHPIAWPEPELAWGLAPATWGRGLATEAARAARDWAFAEARLPTLASFIAADNAASQRVAARLGAVREGSVVIRGVAAERWVHPPPGRGVLV